MDKKEEYEKKKSLFDKFIESEFVGKILSDAGAAVLFIILGISSMVLGVSCLAENSRLVKECTQTTSGRWWTITDHSSKGGSSYRAHINYYVDGVEYKLETKLRSRRECQQYDHVQTVYYDPDDPENAFVVNDIAENRADFRECLFLAGICTIFSVAKYIKYRKLKKRVEMLEQKYPEGTRICLDDDIISDDTEQLPIPKGTLGTVVLIYDDYKRAIIYCIFDDGGLFEVDPCKDSFHKVDEQEENAENAPEEEYEKKESLLDKFHGLFEDDEKKAERRKKLEKLRDRFFEIKIVNKIFSSMGGMAVYYLIFIGVGSLSLLTEDPEDNSTFWLGCFGAGFVAILSIIEHIYSFIICRKEKKHDEKIEMSEQKYHEGVRICLDSLCVEREEYYCLVPKGTLGTIDFIINNERTIIFCNFDNGYCLNVILGEDSFHIVDEQEENAIKAAARQAKSKKCKNSS